MGVVDERVLGSVRRTKEFIELSGRRPLEQVTVPFDEWFRSTNDGRCVRRIITFNDRGDAAFDEFKLSSTNVSSE